MRTTRTFASGSPRPAVRRAMGGRRWSTRSPKASCTRTRVTIRAFAVSHSEWKYAFGYRIETPDRTIVLSGDTRPSRAVATACHGCDVLIHEVYSDSGFKTVPAVRQAYHAQAHTSATELGTIATDAGAKLLILYHQLVLRCVRAEQLLREVKSTFAGLC